MTTEDRLRQALHGADTYSPSPDLFAKVKRSVAEDAAHRRRIRRILAGAIAGMTIVVAFLAAMAQTIDGETTVPWWAIEAATTALLVTLTVGFGPMLRRFGRIYVGNVFRVAEPTGRHFLALLDVAYYLVFSSYILLFLTFVPDTTSTVLLVEAAVRRVAGLLLLMGILHSVTVVVLPVVGLVFSSSWWRAKRRDFGPDAPKPLPAAVTADRVAGAIVWIAAAFMLLGALLLVVQILLGAAGV